MAPAGTSDYETFQEAFGLVSPSKFTNIRLRHGDRVRITSPSGGGYGDPLERDPAKVLHDVVLGFVSRSSAESIYGVVIAGGEATGDSGQVGSGGGDGAAGDPAVDEAATAELRRVMRDGVA